MVIGPSSFVAAMVSCRFSCCPAAGWGAVNVTAASTIEPAGTATTLGAKAKRTTLSESLPDSSTVCG